MKVIYSIDGKQVAEIAAMPFTYLWPPEKGSHILKAEARTSDGKTIAKTVFFIIK